MYCAKCISDNIQKPSLVYESGITHTTLRSRGIGFGAGGLVLAARRRREVPTLAPTRSAAPPLRRPIAIAILGLIFAASHLGVSMTLFSLFVAAISGVVAYQRIKWNGNMYRTR